MTRHRALPQELERRARRFFRVSFADVEIRADSLVEGYGARALALGRHVLLSPSCTDFEQLEHRVLLGHELAHVVQQRQGRVPATGRLGRLPLNDDPVLEAEAEDLGRRFAAGDPAPAPWRRQARSSRRRTPADPIVQRTVIADGQLLTSFDQLTPDLRQVLTLVHGARMWLEWAIAEPGQVFQFPDAGALAEGVQVGLHGSPLMLLPRLELMVSPNKLLLVPQRDLEAICEWEQDGGKGSHKKVIQTILRRNELWTRADLEAAKQFLVDHGVATAPVVQVLGLLDQIALLGLLDDPETSLGRLPDELTTEAAKFGVEHADNPRELVDYLQFYLATVEKLGFDKTTKGAVSDRGKSKLWRRAQGVLDELRPSLPELLRAFAFPRPPTPEALAQTLGGWIGAGNPLGFARMSAAAYQVYRHSDLRQQTGADLSQIVEDYVARAQRLLTRCRPARAGLLQDGATRRFEVEGPEGRAILVLTGGASLTLQEFVPRLQEDAGE